MKRDMDLIREILRIIEERPDDSKNYEVAVPGRSVEELRLHLNLAKDAGLIQGLMITRGNMIVQRLTNEGYNFLEASRNDSLWNKAKELTLRKTGGLALTALTESLKIVVQNALST